MCEACSPTGERARNPGMCPDRESNRWPFSSQAGAQSTEPHQPELIYLFLEREEERERNINVWLPLTCSNWGTGPQPRAHALTGNRTGDLSVHRLALNPVSHTFQDSESLIYPFSLSVSELMHVGSLTLSCIWDSHTRVCIKFGSFLLLICLMSIWLLNQQEEPWG